MKKYLISLSVLVLIAGGAYYLGLNKKEKNIEQGSAAVEVQKKETVISMTEDFVVNSGWIKYSDNYIEFEYPDNIISVVKDGNKINLNHSLIYKHNYFCDAKGSGIILDEFTDFSVSIRVFDKDMKGTLDETQGWLAKEYFTNGTFKLSPGFVDSFKIGNLKGYQVISGAEGCGNYTYYFPISSSKTLLVVRDFIPELNPINAQKETYFNLPGVIVPSKEEEIFTKIMTSLKVK